MTLKIQTVLFKNDPAALQRFLVLLVECIRELGQRVTVHVGDCSDRPLLSAAEVARWRRALEGRAHAGVEYRFFGSNLGFGRGHNQLWREDRRATRLLIVNPDALPAIHLLSRLSRCADALADSGAVEARQVPIEHPKGFNMQTWETSWVSGACVLVDAAAFEDVGGFDEHFFLYGEDVDLSWRLRASGKTLYYCPDTFVFHAKRLIDGSPGMSAAEHYHGPLSLLLLRAKYGREDLNVRMLDLLQRDPRPASARMLADYHRLRSGITPLTDRQTAMASFTPEGDLLHGRWTYPLSYRMATAP